LQSSPEYATDDCSVMHAANPTPILCIPTPELLMATDVERLIVALEARTTAFERALRQANGSANRQARSIERRFQQMNRNLSAGFAGVGSSITKAFAVAGGIRGMQTLLDSATRIENALKVAG